MQVPNLYQKWLICCLSIEVYAEYEIICGKHGNVENQGYYKFLSGDSMILFNVN